MMVIMMVIMLVIMMVIMVMMTNPMDFEEECATVTIIMVSIFIKQSHMINLKRRI